jgi:hypothetical protein
VKNITIRGVPELVVLKFKLLSVGMGKTQGETLSVIVGDAWKTRADKHFANTRVKRALRSFMKRTHLEELLWQYSQEETDS